MTMEKQGNQFYVGSLVDEVCTMYVLMSYYKEDNDYYFDDEHAHGLYLTKEQAERYSECTKKKVTEGYWLIMLDGNYVQVINKEALVDTLYRLG